MIGFTELIVIASVVLVAFNFRRIPELIGSVAKTVKGVRDGMDSDDENRRQIKDVRKPSGE